jgi:predicted RNase H-like HicB family nuclease
MNKKVVTHDLKGIIKGKIPVIYFKEGKQFVAYSPVLDLSTRGDTEEQALARFSEAANIFFNEIIKMGTLEDVLTECGWKKMTAGNTWSPPVYKHKLIPITEGVC